MESVQHTFLIDFRVFLLNNWPQPLRVEVYTTSILQYDPFRLTGKMLAHLFGSFIKPPTNQLISKDAIYKEAG